MIFGILLATMMIPESVTMIPNFLMIRGDILPLPGGSWLNKLPALTVPFMGARLTLGTWQQIIFIDFDNRSRRRELVVQMMGE